MGRNKVKYTIPRRYKEMENNDYKRVSCGIRQVGLRHTWLTKQQRRTTKKILFKGLCVSLYTIMFSLNPLLSKTSHNDLILSSDIPLSKEELIQIKNKIEQERIVAPCWIHIGDKMYLIEKKQLETQSDKENKGSSQDSSKHQT